MSKIIIVDVESTCWESNQVPSGEQSEIIEIGICALDGDEILNPRSLFIKPTRSKISPFCTQLTTITPAMVADGLSFAEACRILQTDYDAKNHLWGSWGKYDLNMFRQQCASFQVNYPFSDQHCNLKQLFAEKHQLPKQVGMARALKIANLDLQGTHHRGVDDAINIARLVRHLLQKYGQSILQSHS